MLLRLLIDTNVIISGTVFRTGNPFLLLELWRAERFRVVTFARQIAEVIDVLGRATFVHRVTPEHVEEILFLLSIRAQRVTPGVAPITVRDPKDQDILGAALSGRVDYLVTGDADLLVLDGDARLGSLRIVTVADFFRLTAS